MYPTYDEAESDPFANGGFDSSEDAYSAVLEPFVLLQQKHDDATELDTDDRSSSWSTTTTTSVVTTHNSVAAPDRQATRNLPFPLEILKEIFRYLSPNTRNSDYIFEMPYRDVSLVCRTFRDIVNGDSSLWTRIHNLMNKECVDVHLSRSKSRNLTIQYFFVHLCADQPWFWNKVFAHRARWEYFRCSHLASQDVNETDLWLSKAMPGHLQGVSFPNLKTLIVSVDTQDSYDARISLCRDMPRTVMELGTRTRGSPLAESFRKCFYENWNMPNLQRVEVTNQVPEFFVKTTLNNLTTFRFDLIRIGGFEVLRLLSFLAEAKQLLHVKVNFQLHAFDYHYGVDADLPEDTPKFRMDALSSLDLSFTQSPLQGQSLFTKLTMRSFIKLLEVPNLKTLRLRLQGFEYADPSLLKAVNYIKDLQTVFISLNSTFFFMDQMSGRAFDSVRKLHICVEPGAGILPPRGRPQNNFPQPPLLANVEDIITEGLPENDLYIIELMFLRGRHSPPRVYILDPKTEA